MERKSKEQIDYLVKNYSKKIETDFNLVLREKTKEKGEHLIDPFNMMVVESYNLDIINYFLMRGQDPNKKNVMGLSTIDHICGINHFNMLYSIHELYKKSKNIPKIDINVVLDSSLYP